MNRHVRLAFERVKGRLASDGGPDAEEALEHLERLSPFELDLLAYQEADRPIVTASQTYRARLKEAG